jgi:hypothetical protein
MEMKIGKTAVEREYDKKEKKKGSTESKTN